METVAAGFVEQEKIRERVKQLQDLLANDPDVLRITHRFGADWSGDDSVFVGVVLSQASPSAATVERLSRQIGSALLDIVRSEELGLHAYLNFSSRPDGC